MYNWEYTLELLTEFWHQVGLWIFIPTALFVAYIFLFEELPEILRRRKR